MALGGAFFSEDQLSTLLGLGEETDMSEDAAECNARSADSSGFHQEEFESAIKSVKMKDGNDFCDEENVYDYLKSVQAKLLLLQLSNENMEITALLDNRETKSIGIAVVDTIYGLLNRLESERCDHQLKAEAAARAQMEIDNLTDNNEQLKFRLNEALDEKSFAHRQLAAERKSFEAQKQELVSKQAKIQRELVSMTSREAQYKHELCRKERMMEGLKDRIKTAQISKNSKEKQSMQMLSSLAIADLSNVAQCESGKCSLYRKMMKEYEKEAKYFEQENRCLRENLMSSCFDIHNIALITDGLCRGEATVPLIQLEHSISETCVHENRDKKTSSVVDLSCKEVFEFPAEKLCCTLRASLAQYRLDISDNLEKCSTKEEDGVESEAILDELEEHKMRTYDVNIAIKKKDLLIGEMQDEVASLRKTVQQLKDKERSLTSMKEEQVGMHEREVEEANRRVLKYKGDIEEMMEAAKLQNEIQRSLVEQLEAEQRNRNAIQATHQQQLMTIMNNAEEHQSQMEIQQKRLQEVMEELELCNGALEEQEGIAKELEDKLSLKEEELETIQNSLKEKDDELNDRAIEVATIKERYKQHVAEIAAKNAQSSKGQQAGTRRATGSSQSTSTTSARLTTGRSSLSTSRSSGSENQAARSSKGPAKSSAKSTKNSTGATTQQKSTRAPFSKPITAAGQSDHGKSAQSRRIPTTQSRTQPKTAIIVEDEELSMIEPVEVRTGLCCSFPQ